jgi:hypothetical protein
MNGRHGTTNWYLVVKIMVAGGVTQLNGESVRCYIHEKISHRNKISADTWEPRYGPLDPNMFGPDHHTILFSHCIN